MMEYILVGILGAGFLGMLGLVVYLVPRRERLSDRYDASRDKIDELLAQQASTSLAQAEEREKAEERIRGLEDEQKMLIDGLEAERRDHRADQVLLKTVEGQRDKLLEAIKLGGGQPSTMAVLVRDELRELQAIAKAAAPVPKAAAPGGR